MCVHFSAPEILKENNERYRREERFQALTFCTDPQLVLFQFEGESHFAAVFVIHARERDRRQWLLHILDANHCIVRLAVLVQYCLVWLKE